MRVVSLVPSVTETLSLWGVTPVAVTRYCERPDLVTVGGTKNPDLSHIIELAPDLVVLDEEENRREDYDALIDAGLAVHVTAVRSLENVTVALRGLATAVHVNYEPTPTPTFSNPRRRAFVPIWRRPWRALGRPTYGASLLSALGVEVLFDEPYPAVDLELAARGSPQLVIAPSEPYPFGERHRHELEAVAPVLFLDGRDLFWWGVRTPGALARLADILARPTEASRAT